MEITFVLPRWSRVPIGGYLMVYKHAKRLAADGHRVHVVHLASLTPQPPRGVAAEVARRVRTLSMTHASIPWREVEGVDVRSLLRLPSSWPAGHLVVATSWQTAPLVAVRAAPGWGFYFLQSYETWSGPQDSVDAGWRLPLHKFAVAHWLVEIGKGLTDHPIGYVPPHVDFAYGGISGVARDSKRVAMCWHPHAVKDSSTGLAAIALVQRRVAGVVPVIFSTETAPAALPEGTIWVRQPSRQDLHNLLESCQVFVSPSLVEGWALPPAEAMACGAALVATDIGGHGDYARHDKTALLFPPGDQNAAAEAIVALLESPAFCGRLAQEGQTAITGFTAELAHERLAYFIDLHAGQPVMRAVRHVA